VTPFNYWIAERMSVFPCLNDSFRRVIETPVLPFFLSKDLALQK
jgi:hypothetical protein